VDSPAGGWGARAAGPPDPARQEDGAPKAPRGGGWYTQRGA
jgi:hypothetical protein